MYREIIGAKIIEKRGNRSRRELAESVGKKISEMDLYYFENHNRQPSKNKLPHLLKALGATFDEISEPVDLGVAK